jgi:hypothetical protein
VERSAETTRDDPDGEYLKRNRWFESGSLHRRVCKLSVPLGDDALVALFGRDALLEQVGDGFGLVAPAALALAFETTSNVRTATSGGAGSSQGALAMEARASLSRSLHHPFADLAHRSCNRWFLSPRTRSPLARPKRMLLKEGRVLRTRRALLKDKSSASQSFLL